MMALYKIEATVPPRSLPLVAEAVRELGLSGMTVTAIHTDLVVGLNWSSFRGSLHRESAPLAGAFLVEIVLSESRLQEAIDELARTLVDAGHGEGRIAVVPVLGATRIRTGATGEAAVCG